MTLLQISSELPYGALTAAAVLLMFSALFSASEVAFFTFEEGGEDALRNDSSKTAGRIQKLLAQPRRLMTSLLIANVFANVGAAVFTYHFFRSGGFGVHPPNEGIWLYIAVPAFAILLLGEIIPRLCASAKPEAIRNFMALPLRMVIFLFSPLSKVFMRGEEAIKPNGHYGLSELSVGDLEQAFELTRDESMEPDEEKILKGIVRFGGTDVKQIMTPRTEVFAFDAKMDFSDVLSEVLERGYSRVPIYRETLDHVIGVLYLKDLLPYAEEKNLYWQNLLRPTYFVPENKKLDDLLKEFQERKVHLAIVVDEYGGTSGIVSLEDILEEVVGEIADEFDDEDIYYSKLDDHNYVFEAKTPLVDMYKILDIDGQEWEEAKGESDTLAGFVLELAGRIPMKNEKVKFHDYTITIEAADRRKVKRVKLSIGRDGDES